MGDSQLCRVLDPHVGQGLGGQCQRGRQPGEHLGAHHSQVLWREDSEGGELVHGIDFAVLHPGAVKVGAEVIDESGGQLLDLEGEHALHGPRQGGTGHLLCAQQRGALTVNG